MNTRDVSNERMHEQAARGQRLSTADLARAEPRQQGSLIPGADEFFPVPQPLDQRRFEQQAHIPNNSLISDGRSSGASWSKVHCFGSLSGRQRRKPVPWRKRRPVT